MKKNLIILLLLVAGRVYGQFCDNPSASIDLHGNNIRAVLLNGGDMFSDVKLTEGLFQPNYQPNSANPSTIYVAGLWIGGIDPAANLSCASAFYRTNGGSDYWPGPLNANGKATKDVCKAWNRFFKVRGADVGMFLANLTAITQDPTGAISKYPSIMGWPGRGNPYFQQVNGFFLPDQALAPFFDANTDGLYNPLDGDYPGVQLNGKPLFVPTEFIWWVYNDEGAGRPHTISYGTPFQIEIQQMAWAIRSTDYPVIDNTIFTSYRIINKSKQLYDSVYVGQFVDFDLGCGLDDYIGCNPAQNAMYVYNTDNIDGFPNPACTGIATFADTVPVQSAVFLNRNMDVFTYSNNASFGNWPSATGDPTMPLEYYNYLTGRWRDGSLILSGGNGYQSASGQPTHFAFSDPPSDPTGWSMCTAGLAFGDRRVVGATKIGLMLPGQITELTLGWTTHYNLDLPCGLGNTLTELDSLQNFFDINFKGVNMGYTGVTSTPADLPFSILPNPASEYITISYGLANVRSIRLYSMDGRLVREVPHPDAERTTVPVGDLANGLYWIEVLAESGRGVQKVAVLR